MENRSLIGKRAYDLSPRAERVELWAVCVALSVVCVALPLLVRTMPPDSWLRQGGEQWIMGSVVNCALVVVGVNFKSWRKSAAVVFLPALCHVVLFFVLATPIFGLYMVPAIWIGNVAILLVFKYLHVHKEWNYGLVAVLGIAIKAGIIFGIFNILVATGVIHGPAVAGLTTRMGINQIYVAAVGCVAAFVILKTLYPRKTKIREVS